MSAYTKGPWKLRSEGSVCVVDGSGNAISFSDTFLPNEQCVANARLQSAAPELLEALKDCEWSDGGGCPQCAATRGEPHQTDCILGNALAKAGAR